LLSKLLMASLVAQHTHTHTHTHAPSVTTMGAVQHYTSPSPGDAHWASIKTGLSASARGRRVIP